jgi:hypothetical protein
MRLLFANSECVRGRGRGRYDPSMNTLLRLLLLLWVIGYLAVGCAPVFGGSFGEGLFGLIVGSVLFVPWVIGIAVLSGLIWLTNRRA